MLPHLCKNWLKVNLIMSNLLLTPRKFSQASRRALGPTGKKHLLRRRRLDKTGVENNPTCNKKSMEVKIKVNFASWANGIFDNFNYITYAFTKLNTCTFAWVFITFILIFRKWCKAYNPEMFKLGCEVMLPSCYYFWRNKIYLQQKKKTAIYHYEL